MSIRIQTAQVRGMQEELDSLLITAKGRYFKPSAYLDLFDRWEDLRESLRSRFPEAFAGVSRRTKPVPSQTSDFEGEGYIERHEFEDVQRQMKHVLTICEALDAEQAEDAEAQVPPRQTVGSFAVTTIGAVRTVLGDLSRSKLHEVLIRAGSMAALQMRYTEKQNHPDYRSKAEMLAEGFDVAVRDTEGGPAFLVELIRVLAKSEPRAIEGSDLASRLSADGYSLAEILGHERPVGTDELRAFVEAGGSGEALDLFKKSWGRVDSDPSGAITAATAMAESVVRKRLQELGVDLEGANQFPDLVGVLSKRTTFDELIPHEERGSAFMKSIRSMAHNAYSLAHEAGDRHGGDRDAPTERETAYTFVSTVSVLVGIVARGVRSGRLKRRE